MINTLLINIHLLLYWHHFLQLKYLFVSNMTAWWQSKQEYIINMMGWGVSEGVKRQNKKVSRCVMARLGHNTFWITRFFSNRADTYFPGKYAFLDFIFWTNFRLALILRISKLIVNEKICRYFFEWRKKKYLYIYFFLLEREISWEQLLCRAKSRNPRRSRGTVMTVSPRQEVICHELTFLINVECKISVMMDQLAFLSWVVKSSC